MLYDDVDVSIIDAKDFFGIDKPVDPFKSATTFDENEPSSANKSNSRKSASKWEFSADSKIFTKQSKKTKACSDIFVGNAPTSSISSLGAGGFGEYRVSEKLLEIGGDFRNRVAASFQEKLSVLEERDRYLRDSVLKGDNKNMDVIVKGTCPDMCPEKERLLREINCSFSSFESQIVQNEMLVVPERLVKEYARSSADQDEPLPHELRPEPVLVDTMSYLLANIVPRIEEGSVDVAEWYHFCWDRLRSIRKDIMQQQLCSVNIVTVLERSARFHICCAERLFDADRHVFDHKINAENLVNCLQMLINMYDDLTELGVYCPNENEFRVYMMLLLLNSGDVPELLDQQDEKASEASRIYFAFKLNLYAEFFKLVKKTSYLNACILQRNFSGVRTHILNVLVKAYSSGSLIVKFPIAFARRVLEFDDNNETIAFAEAHGFTTFYDGTGGAPEIRCSKASFVVPEQTPVCKSSGILRSKRVPILQAITATSDFVPQIRTAKVHSSFSELDALKDDAQFADDQRQRVIELYGNIYESCEDEMMTEAASMRVETPIKESRPLFSLRVTPEVTHPSTLPAIVPPVSQSNFSFANIKSISTFNFGSIKYQPSSTQFHSNEVQFYSPVISATSYDESDRNIGSVCSDSVTFTEGISSRSVLYDPEDVTDSDVDEQDAQVPDLEQPVAAQDEKDVTLELEFTMPKIDKEVVAVESKSNAIINSPKLPSTPPVRVIRNSQEVVDRLSNALNTFQSLYYYNKEVQVVPASINEACRQITSHKLRKLVARRLKLSKARKYARLWRKKTKRLKHKRDNFVGIVHLSPEEYFRLWGAVGTKERSIARNLAAEVIDADKALRWSSMLLRTDDLWRIPFAGDELADMLCRVPGIQCRSRICWKMLVSLPRSQNDCQRNFTFKISKLVRALYCGPGDDVTLGSVWSTQMHGVQVYLSVKMHTDIFDIDSVAGTSCVVMFVCEKWEKLEELAERLDSICLKRRYPLFVGAIILSDSNCASFSTKVSNLLSERHKHNTISGYRVIVWKRWLTICQVVANACQGIPRSPLFQVRNVVAFVQQIGNDLFTWLQYAGVASATALSSPIPFIRTYNECLMAAARLVCMRDMDDFNLSSEFVEALTGGGAETRTNFLHRDCIISAVADFALVSFTKWPPKSWRKMKTLLTDYCRKLDPKDALLANVFRLIRANDAETVAEINERAPWAQIVELWFQFRLRSMSSDKYEKLYVIYAETEMKELVERVAIQQMY